MKTEWKLIREALERDFRNEIRELRTNIREMKSSVDFINTRILRQSFKAESRSTGN